MIEFDDAKYAAARDAIPEHPHDNPKDAIEWALKQDFKSILIVGLRSDSSELCHAAIVNATDDFFMAAMSAFQSILERRFPDEPHTTGTNRMRRARQRTR